MKQKGKVFLSFIIVAMLIGVAAYSQTVGPTGIINFPWINGTRLNVQEVYIQNENYTENIVSGVGGGWDGTGALFQNGTRELTDNWDAGAYNVTADNFTATDFYLESIGNLTAYVETLIVDSYVSHFLTVSGGTYYAYAGGTLLDSSATLTTVFNSIMGDNPGNVLVGVGTFTNTGALNATATCNIIGSGRSKTVFSNANNGDVFFVTASRVGLKHFTVDGNNGAVVGRHGIYIYRSSGHRLEDLKVYDCDGDDIHIGESSGSFSTIQCLGGKITQCYLGDTTQKTTGSGIYVDYAATDWEITNSIMAEHETAGEAGMVIDGSNLNTALNHLWGNYYHVRLAINAPSVEGWLSNGDKFMDGKRNAIYKGAEGNWWKNSQISGGYFWYAGEDAIDTYDSIDTTGNVRCIEIQANFRGENTTGTHITKFIWEADANVDYCRITGIVEGYNEADPITWAGTGCDDDVILFDCS